MAKIGITATGPSLDADISPMAARAPYFLIVEKNGETKLIEAYQNTWAGGGAGPRAAQYFISKAVDVVIAGAVGPNFGGMLNTSGIKIVQASGKIKEVLEKV